MDISKSVDIYKQCKHPFITTTESTNLLLDVLGDFNHDFALHTNSKLMFDGLLRHFLELTASEYGFIGERLVRNNGEPYLKTHSITNIAWDDATHQLYEKHAEKGMEFEKMNSLYGQVIYNGRPLISNDPETDPRACGLPHGHPALDSFLGIPLFIADQYIGMVGIANRTDGYDEEILHYLNPLITSTAALIHAARMEDMARHDYLTGVSNRRLFEQLGSAEISAHYRHNKPLSLMLIDIDHFKNINDTFGHSCGDRALIKVAEIISTRVRAEDIVARLGGEEFVVLLPETTIENARVVAEELRHSISETRFKSLNSNKTISLTISIGLVSLNHDEKIPLDEFIDRADKAMYNAKKHGRNRVYIGQ